MINILLYKILAFTIQKKIYGSGTTPLIISNEEMEDVMKIVKSHEELGLLIQGISETIKNETKEEKGGFPPVLLRTLAASVLWNALAGKDVIRLGDAATSFNYFWNIKILPTWT